MKIARNVSLLFSLVFVSLTAFGATRTWTGAGGDARWSNAANWTGGIVPANGDDLLFGGQSTTNDLAGLSLSSITVTSGSPAFSGNAVSAGAVHVLGGALLLKNPPFDVNSSDSIDGGTLELQNSTTGNVTVDRGALEVTSQYGVSHAQSLRLGPSSQFVVDSWAPNGGLAAAKNIDYLVVHGDVSLGGSMLSIKPWSFPGQTHTLIRNEGPNPVSGTFQGLPEGAMFLQTFYYRITYQGGSSGRDVVVVPLFGTAVHMWTSQDVSNWGSPVLLTANVRSYGQTPTGSVEFFDGAQSLGKAILGPGTTVGFVGMDVAQITTYALSAGTHAIIGVYSGGDLFGPSTSSALTQTVRDAQALSATTLSGSPSPAYAGQKVSFTALVKGPGGLIPSGSVTLLDGGAALGTVSLDATGQATFGATFTRGTHSVSATFAGSQHFAGSTSNSITETVADLISTQTELVVSPNPAKANSPVILRATVDAASGSPQGIVNFLEGSKTLGSAIVAADRTASLTIDTFAAGMHTLTATYLGSDAFTVSASVPVSVQVNEQVDTSRCDPEITTPPADTQLSPEGSATMTVSASGDQPQAFRWYLGSYPDTSHPVGSTATVTITNLWGSSDVWVMVTNSCGSVEASAHLSAFVPSRRRSVGSH